jgi:hypothetical protein
MESKARHNEKYLVWDFSSSTKTYSVDRISATGVESFEIVGDVQLASRWPADAKATLTDGSAKKPALDDSMLNTDRLRIVSARLKKALEDLEVTDVEFLPVKLENDSKMLDVTCYIVHPINRPDCLDLKASEAKMSVIAPTKVNRVKRIVLKSDPDRKLFIISNYNNTYIIRWDIAEALSEIGFSGVRWTALFDYENYAESNQENPIWKKARELYEKIHKKGKIIELPPLVKSKVKRATVPAAFKKWLKENSKETFSVPFEGRPGGGQRFVPQTGDYWLEGYEDSKEEWPNFDPSRYCSIGTDDNGNFWLFDLEAKASVVYFSHEEGYNDRFGKESPSWSEFVKKIKPTQNNSE